MAIVSICTLLLAHPVLGQQTVDAPSTTQTSDLVAPKDPPVQNSQKPDNDRIFWTLPNYLTVEKDTQLPKLTVGRKFKLVADGTFDPVEFAFIGLEASVNQATNANPTFGQGMIGYAKRYGTAFTDNTIENFMVGGAYPSLFGQDPRYYQLGKGSFVHRAAYAALRVFIIRSDSGKTEFNFSEILGSGTAAVASNIYHPAPRTVRSNLSVWGTQIGWDSVSFELKEFWPDIHRHLRRSTSKS